MSKVEQEVRAGWQVTIWSLVVLQGQGHSNDGGIEHLRDAGGG